MGEKPQAMVLRDLDMHWGSRTYIMAILNVTPDSFSGDGLLGSEEQTTVHRAVEQARAFVTAGADLIDVGGESTRPGAEEVEATAERQRVVPVITAIRAALNVPLSIDTWKASVAEAALDAGADLVNDVWGLRLPSGGWNTELAQLVGARGVPSILTHNRRAQASTSSQGGHYRAIQYVDLIRDIIRELQESVALAHDYGIRSEQIIIDPGIGFGKTPAQNIELLRHLAELRELSLPLLLGTSRKSFIGLVLDLPPDQRVEGTAATVALGIQAGADLVRVHDVGPIVRVARMTDAIVRGEMGSVTTSGQAPLSSGKG